MVTGAADLLVRLSTADLLTKRPWLAAATPPRKVIALGSYLALARVSESGSTCDCCPMVRYRPFGSARLAQSLSASTPPAPGWFTTIRRGLPGRWRVRCCPIERPYRSVPD